MAKIRSDFAGCVVAAGGVRLRAGDDVPDGLKVAPELLEPIPEPAPVKATAKK